MSHITGIPIRYIQKVCVDPAHPIVCVETVSCVCELKSHVAAMIKKEVSQFQLIEAVRCYPQLWDLPHESYKDRITKLALWEEIAA